MVKMVIWLFGYLMIWLFVVGCTMTDVRCPMYFSFQISDFFWLPSDFVTLGTKLYRGTDFQTLRCNVSTNFQLLTFNYNHATR